MDNILVEIKKEKGHNKVVEVVKRLVRNDLYVR